LGKRARSFRDTSTSSSSSNGSSDGSGSGSSSRGDEIKKEAMALIKLFKVRRREEEEE